LSPEQITAVTPAEMLVDYVRIYDNGYTQLGGSSIPEKPPVPGQEYLGSWFNQDQDGHGFSMAFGELENGDPVAVVYWYTYDDKGNPIFLLGSGNLDGSRLEIELESPTGMRYGEFNSVPYPRDTGGTAVFEFSSTQNATFSYAPSEFSVSTWGHSAIEALPITRLFTIPVTDSSITTQ
jgi:hypothetical protein